MRRVTVAGDRPYEVVIGPGRAGRARRSSSPGRRRPAVVHAPPLAAAAGAAVETLQTAGVAAEAVVVPDGEAAKTAEVAAGLWEEFGRLGLTRSDAVVGIGGGAVTDLAGFAGRDLDPRRPRRPGADQPARHGRRRGRRQDRDQHRARARTWSAPSTRRPPCWPTPTSWPGCRRRSSARAWPRWSSAASSPTARSSTCSTPTRPAAATPRSSSSARCGSRPTPWGRTSTTPGRREFLNYGHTLGHAIERVEDFGWRHGEAVAVGLVFAAELAGQAGLLDPRRRRPAPHAGRRAWACPPGTPATGPRCRR